MPIPIPKTSAIFSEALLTSSMVTETGIFRIPPFFVCVTASKEGIMSERRKEGRSMDRRREIVLGIGDGMSSSKRQTDTKERVRFDLFLPPIRAKSARIEEINDTREIQSRFPCTFHGSN